MHFHYLSVGHDILAGLSLFPSSFGLCILWARSQPCFCRFYERFFFYNWKSRVQLVFPQTIVIHQYDYEACSRSRRGAFTSFIHLWHVLIYLGFVSVLPFAFLFVKGKQTENRSVCVWSVIILAKCERSDRCLISEFLQKVLTYVSVSSL